jgi:lactate dehydrogenase-like 2-hydroxyacid dehydrogenase
MRFASDRSGIIPDADVDNIVHIAGAGLDVVTHEPDVPQQLREIDNVVVLPHVGSATARTRAAMTALTLRNLDEYLTRGTLTTPVVAPTR